MSRKLRVLFAVAALLGVVTTLAVTEPASAAVAGRSVAVRVAKKKPVKKKVVARPVSPLRGTVNVFAAASLTEAFQAEAAVFHFLAPGVNFNLNFAGSQILVQQIQAGAPADVVATADEASMRTLSAANLLATNAFLFAHNRLAIMTAKGNPKNIQTLADLARPDVKVDLCAPVVPCGKFAQQILGNAKVTVTPVSLETDVKGVVAKINSGDADAGITYVTDALAAKDTTDSVRIPDENNVINAYPVAEPRTASPQDDLAARYFILFLFTPLGQFILGAHGFLGAA
jgi:molybdate transport system substrate-binding protein